MEYRKNKVLKPQKIYSRDPARIAESAARFGVIQIIPPPATTADFIHFLSSLGSLMFTDGEIPVAQFPQLNIVTNVNRKTKPRSVFHSDTSYVAQPPSISALIAIEVPTIGGATLFTNQYTALEALPSKLRSKLIGAEVLHAATNSPDSISMWHPLIRRNPVTNRDSLFLTSRERCRLLRLEDGTDRTDLLDKLYNTSLQCAPLLKHDWSRGDVLLWDNRCTLHSADHSTVEGPRTLFRGLIRGERPVAASRAGL